MQWPSLRPSVPIIAGPELPPILTHSCCACGQQSFFTTPIVPGVDDEALRVCVDFRACNERTK
jgi:hypothetical protein